MTPCARGCCWNPWGCSLAYDCRCHWDDRKLAPRNTGDSKRFRDPTADTAIRNMMKGQPK